jgi:hypothetical protein
LLIVDLSVIAQAHRSGVLSSQSTTINQQSTTNHQSKIIQINNGRGAI